MAASSRLRDLCEQIVDCPHSTPVWSTSGFTVLRSQNIRGGRLDLTSRSYTDHDHFRERTRRALPRPGDLVITREAPMGEVCMIPGGLECCLGQRMVLLRPSKVVDGRYLLFALQSRHVQHQIGCSEGTGSTVSNLRIPLLEALEIPTPELRTQRAIAHILGTLDDKIELNRRTNETLEAMARALFKSWFVDFDPVRAKAAGKQPAGMDAATAALFPSEFVESEVGEIPKGWRTVSLGETYTWSREGVDPAEAPTTPFEHFSLPAFDAGRSPTIDLGATIKSLKFLVVPNSVLASKLNPAISRVWLPFPSGHGPAVCSTEFLVAVANANVPRAWLYGVFLSDPIREAMVGQASGTSNSHQRVRPDDIDAIAVALPDQKLLAHYDGVAAPLHDRSNDLRVESARLAQIRDALLPRLLSGELRISDAERIVGAAP